VEAARTAARRRLVGALILLLFGVVGFPILFETQPRPLPVDTPIEAARSGGFAATTAAPPRATRPLPVLPVDAGTESAPDPAPASASAPKAATSVPAASPKAAPSVPVAAPMAAAMPVAAPKAAAVVAAAPPKPASAAVSKPASAPTPADAASGARFVVQVGAYADATKLREARAKVEQLGLKTYTQVIDGDTGSRTRVRVGPFVSRAEADTVAAKVKRAGLPTAVLAL
jgi:DedD protein